MTQFHLVQVNVARLLAPEGDPKVAGFFDNIDRINASAESSEGFVWRYTGDYEPDPMIVYNASIWESLEHLSRFVYRSDHLSIFRQRESWFAPMDKPSMALWWAEKKLRLRILKKRMNA